MHGALQILTGSEGVMTGVVASLVEAGIRAPTSAGAALETDAVKKTSERRGKPAQRDYWRRMRALRLEYDFSPRVAGSLRAMAKKHRIPYGSTFNAFKAIREDYAPFPDEEPPAPRPPVSKPNGKLL